MDASIAIVPAMVEDCKRMSACITSESKEFGAMLPKSEADIMISLSSYFVAKEGEEIVGTCGLKIWPTRQVEVVSLWVKKEKRGGGIGKLLVEACITRARSQGFKEVFALAISPSFFEKFGFQQVGFTYFQAKIWTDCLRCPKNLGCPGNPNCPEVPVLLIFS